MLSAKDSNLNNCVELVWSLFEKTLSAKSDDVVHKFEEASSELRKVFFVVFDHIQGWRAQRIKDLRQELSQVLAVLSENGGKQHESLRVASKWI